MPTGPIRGRTRLVEVLKFLPWQAGRLVLRSCARLGLSHESGAENEDSKIIHGRARCGHDHDRYRFAGVKQSREKGCWLYLCMVPAIALLAACGVTNDSPGREQTGEGTVLPADPLAGYSPSPISREQWLAGLWGGEGPPPTPLPVVRESTYDDYLGAVGRCMDEAGWPNLAEEEETTEFLVPEGQWQAFHEAHYQCYAQYPLAPEFYQRHNLDQLKALWVYQTGEMLECLDARGFRPEDPPTLERFVSDYENDVVPRWFPYDNVPDPDRIEVELECPLLPEGFYELATLPGGDE